LLFGLFRHRKQSFQQSHTLWIRADTSLIWLWLRRAKQLVEVQRARERHKHSDLGCGRRSVVEIARALVSMGGFGGFRQRWRRVNCHEITAAVESA